MRAAEAGPFAEADAVVRSATGLAFPGAVLSVGVGGRPVHRRAFGRLSYEAGAGEARPDSLYDLASLTKVVVTTTLAMILVDEGRLDLDAPVSAFFPSFTGRGRDGATIRHLLSHTSGLPPWAPLFRKRLGAGGVPGAHRGAGARVRAGSEGVLLGPRLHPARRGARARGRRAPRAARPRAGARAARRCTTRCSGRRPRFGRGSRRPRTTPGAGGCCTARCTTRTPSPWAAWRDTRGSSAAPRTSTGSRRRCSPGTAAAGRRIVSSATVSRFTRRVPVAGVTRALGWDTAADGTGRRSSVPGSPGYSSAGSLLSDRSFGHTGFTGTSVLDRPGARGLGRAADEPRAPDAGQRRDPRRPCARGGRRRPGLRLSRAGARAEPPGVSGSC